MALNNLMQWQVVALLALMFSVVAISGFALVIRRSRYNRAIRQRIRELADEGGQLAVVENNAQRPHRNISLGTSKGIAKAA